MVFEIMKLQQAEIESLKLEKLLHNVELPLIRVMAQMEYNGFSLDSYKGFRGTCSETPNPHGFQGTYI